MSRSRGEPPSYESTFHTGDYEIRDRRGNFDSAAGGSTVLGDGSMRGGVMTPNGVAAQSQFGSNAGYGRRSAPDAVVAAMAERLKSSQGVKVIFFNSWVKEEGIWS